MKIKIIASLSTIILITGCASVTPISPAGRDTYLVAGSDALEVKSGVNIKANLYQKANAYCESAGKQFLPLNDTVGSHEAQLRFRCLNADDPEFVRPNMQPVPNVRIESN